MKINSIQWVLDQHKKTGLPVWDLAIREESAETGADETAIRAQLQKTLEAMRAAVKGGLRQDMRSVTGMTGGDAYRYHAHAGEGKALLGPLAAKAISYALATSEYNAAMGVIVAAPTAGSAGILPGLLIAAQEELGFDDTIAQNALMTASVVGCVIAEKATLAGAVGGCQAECGSAAAMAAAALCCIKGADLETCMHGAALALKNTLGLACDPVAGLVEVPCVKRNGVYTILALTAADMALAGIRSFIPPDEVIEAMGEIGRVMPSCIRETAEGGLATTATGLLARNRLFGEK